MKKIQFYGYVFDYSVSSFIEEMNEAEASGDDVAIVTNCYGGSVLSGWGLIATLSEFPNNKKIMVHGNASSMMAYALLFCEDTSCIPQSIFLLHRASTYRDDEASMNSLKKTNADLRKAFEVKIDIPAFEKIAGVDLDRFFDGTKSVVDVELDAKQAKKIGLIKNIVPLSPKRSKEINAEMITACGGQGVQMIKIDEPEAVKKPIISNKMTKAELEKDHPTIVAEIIASATPAIQLAAVANEKARANSFLAYHEIDSKAAIEGAKGDKALTPDVQAEFQVTALKTGFVKNASEGGNSSLDTEAVKDETQTAAQKEEEAFKAELKEHLKN